MIQTSFINPFPIPGVSIPDDLVLYCKLESDSDVQSPTYGNAGVVVGNPTYEAAKYNNGVQTSNSNYVKWNLDDLSIFDSGMGAGAGSFTIEYWQKCEFSYDGADIDNETNDPSTNLSINRAGFTNSSDINVNWRSDRNPACEVRMRINGTNYTCSNVDESGAAVQFSDNSLNHFAFVFDDSDDTVYFYINGTLHIHSGTVGASDTVNSGASNGLAIGTNNIGGIDRRPTDGPMDDLIIWSSAKSDFSHKDNEGY